MADAGNAAGHVLSLVRGALPLGWQNHACLACPGRLTVPGDLPCTGHIYTDENGIGLEEIVGDELHPVPGGDAYANSNKLFLHPYDDGRIIVSERDGLLSLYDGQKVTPFRTPADEYLKAHRLYTSILLRDGGLCLTTLNGGAVIVAHDGKLRQILDVSDGLLDPGALSAFQDRDGTLWIGTTAGVSRVEIASPISIFSRNGPAGCGPLSGVCLCSRRRRLQPSSQAGL